MKINLNKIAKALLCAVVAMVSVTFVACDDQPDEFKPTDGTPVIKYIRMSVPESADSLITEAYMEAVICIVGDNLKSVHEIWFNDQKAALNTSYMTDHTIIVAVPGTIPAEVSDKIFFKTHSGATVEYDFGVVVPEPVIYSMSNEWAKPGDEVTIIGNYFCDDPNVPIKVELPGKIIVTEFTEVAINRLSFILPDDATTEGRISVTSIYGSGKSPFQFHDSRGMLFDFDGATGLAFVDNCWHGHTAKSDEYSLNGNYVQMGNGEKVFSSSTTWIDDAEVGYFLEYWPGNWEGTFPASGQGMKLSDLVDFSNWENMSLKFEMLIPAENPWYSGVPMQIIVSNPTQAVLWAAGWDFFNGSADKQSPRAFYRPWRSAEGGVYHTDGKWTTVTIPLNTLTFDNDGAATANPITGPDSFAGITIAIVGGSVEEDQNAPIVKIDNIRAVTNL